MKQLSLALFFSILLFAVSSCGQVKTTTGAVPAGAVFRGRSLVAFGNSITAAENSWAYQLYKQLDFGSFYNGAVGGAIWSKRERTTRSGKTIRTQNYGAPGFAGISNSNAANPDDSAFQKRINNCAIVHIQKYLADKTVPLPDVIILSYGTNDLNSAAVLGNTTAVLREKDPEKLDLYTMAGAVKWSIQTLQTRFPKAKLYVALPLQAKSEKRNADNRIKIGVIKKICDGMQVPAFDCYTESGITQENSGQYLRDGLHPNEEGKKLHAQYVIKKLKAANE